MPGFDRHRSGAEPIVDAPKKREPSVRWKVLWDVVYPSGIEVRKLRCLSASRFSRVRRFAHILVLVFVVTVANQNASAADDAATTVIGDVTVISPERSAPLEHAWVRIQGGRIAEASSRPLKGGVQIDGRGKFLIPGLIDTHVHLTQVPGMEAPQRSAHPDLAALELAQGPRSYLYFGFITVLSLGDATAPFIEQWNALAVRPDAYFCGGSPIVNGYSFQGFAASPYFLFNADQAGTIPASVDKAKHTPQAVVQQMSRDGGHLREILLGERVWGSGGTLTCSERRDNAGRSCRGSIAKFE
jgi:hypothetical protein